MARDSSIPIWSAGARVGQNPDAIAAEVGGDIVLLNVATGYFHQLNAVGSYVWRQIADPQTFAELNACALRDFEGDADTCRQEIQRFVQDLLEHGLVRIL
jgi:hypothetical protein